MPSLAIAGLSLKFLANWSDVDFTAEPGQPQRGPLWAPAANAEGAARTALCTVAAVAAAEDNQEGEATAFIPTLHALRPGSAGLVVGRTHLGRTSRRRY